ncbi:MAG: FKBP-type peptidyl-prolyl cis-trans isomerase [Bacteroidaceae bacterium]|nr:FKBP-type peptidyl-prolyl cis-trans isomerase [Bacteroidaceae bacterium]
MDKFSYALGLGIGQNLLSMGLSELNTEDFVQAINDVIKGNDLVISHKEAQAIVTDYFNVLEERANDASIAEGEEFLKINGQKAGVVTTASGLQYQVLKRGEGKKPSATDRVRCHYRGSLINGKVFDSSYDRNEPADFPLNQVIAGWTEALQLMAEGSQYRLFIPYHLGYGERGAGAMIPPYSTLIFDVELIKVL